MSSGKHYETGFRRWRSLAVGIAVYAVILAVGLTGAWVSIGDPEPTPPWSDDMLPAAAMDVLPLLWAFSTCQIIAFGCGVSATFWYASNSYRIQPR